MVSSKKLRLTFNFGLDFIFDHLDPLGTRTLVYIPP